MAANNSNGGAPGAISVAVTTQGSEAAINALNQSLAAMGGLLATVNTKLDENEARLVKLNKNANALAATIGGQSRIASTALKNQAIADQGNAGVFLKQQNFLAGQQIAFAKSLNSQAKVQAEETLRSSRFKGGSTGLLASVKNGTLSSKDLRQVALATKAVAEQEANAKLLERSNATLRMLDRYDQQIVKLKEAEVKTKKDQAAAERKMLADQRTARVKEIRESTAAWRRSNAQEQSDFEAMKTSQGMALVQAGARASTEGRAARGFRQQQAERAGRSLEKSGQLMGPNRKRYWDGSDLSASKNGIPQIQGMLQQAQLHVQALERKANRSGAGVTERATIKQEQDKIGIEIDQLTKALRALTARTYAQSPMGQGVAKLNSVDKANAKLAGVDLSGARNVAAASNTGLTGADFKFRKEDIEKARRQAQSAMDLAKNAGNQTALDDAKALNKVLRDQWVIVDGLAKAERQRAADAKTAATQAKTAATAKYQFMQMNEQAGLAALNNPSQAPFLGAAAQASMDAKVRQGMNRVRIQDAATALQQQGVLVGPKVADAYYKGGTDYTGQSATQLQERLRGLEGHREALKFAATDMGKYKITTDEVTKALAALKLQEQDLNRILATRTKLDFQNSASGRAQDVNKAKSTLAGMNLAPATALAGGSVTGLTEDKWMEKKLALETQLGQAKKAYNLATITGDTAAIKNAETLINKLQAQKTELKAMEDLKRSATNAAAREKAKFDTLSNQTFRTNSIESQIKGAKTVLELERLKRDEIGKQLNQAKDLEALAKKRGDTATQERAAKLVAQYTTEQNQIGERTKQIKDEGKYTRAYQERLTPEGQGSSFLNRAMLLKDYMLMGSLTSSIAGAYSFLKDFESALKQTQAIAQGTERQMQGLRGAILDVSDSSRFGAIELTEATTILAQAGFSISEIQSSLSSVATLATATGSSLKDSVEIATSVMGAFKMASTTMPEVVNQITQAMNLSKLDIPKFMLATQYAGNAASDLGVSFREMLTATAAVSNTGIRSGSTMGTGMRQLLADLTSPTDKMKKKLLDLGLSFRDVDVRINGLTGVMKNLKEAGFSTADAFDSFELRAANYYVALSNNLGAYDKMYAQMDDQTSAATAQEIQMNSLAAQTDRMTNQFKIMADVLGKDLRNSLTYVFRGTADLTEKFNQLADDGIQSAIVNIVVMTGVFTAAILMLRNLGVVLTGVIGLLAAKKAAIMGVAGAGRFLMLGVSLPWIAGIALAMSVAAVAASRWKSEQEELADAVEKSTSIYKTAQESVSGYTTSITEIDEKLKSLSARTISLGDNQAELAVEFDIVRRKALELGVDLKTKVESTVVSLKEAWVEMRTEMQKRIYVDMQYEGVALENKQTTERAAYAGLLRDVRGFGRSETASAKFQVFNTKTGQFEGINLPDNPNSEIFAKMMLSGAGGASVIDMSDIKALKTPGEILEDASGNRQSKLNLNQLLSKLEQSMIDPSRLPVLMPEMEVLYSKISADVSTVTANLAKIIASTDDMKLRSNAIEQQRVFSRYFTDPTNEKGLGYFFAQARNISAQQRVLDVQRFDTAVAGVASKGPSGSLTEASKGYLGVLNLQAPVAPAAKTGALKVFNTHKDAYIAASAATGIPASVLVALSFRESSGRTNAGSDKDALGLTQMQPSAAASVGYSHADMLDPAKSIMAGALYLQKTTRLVTMRPGMGDQATQGLRAYHAGLGNWENNKGIGPINEGYAPGIGALAREISEAVDGRQIIREGVKQTPQQRELSAEITIRKDQALAAAQTLKLIETALARNQENAKIMNDRAAVFKRELTALEAKGYEPNTPEAKKVELLRDAITKIAAYNPAVEATNQQHRAQKLALEARESENQRVLSSLYVEQSQLLSADKQDASLARDKELIQLQIERVNLETKLVGLQAALYRLKPEDGLDAYNKAEAEVTALQKQIALAESRRKQLAEAEQGTSTSSFLLGDAQLMLNDKELQQQTARLTVESDNRKIEAAKRYKEHIRKTTQEAFDYEVEMLKKSTAENKRQLDVRQKDFEDFSNQLSLDQRLAADTMKNQRARMDLTQYRGKYTEGERSALDEKIRLEEEYIADTLARENLVITLTEAKTRLERLVLDRDNTSAGISVLRERSLNPLINETEAEQRANIAKIKDLEDLVRDYGVEINRTTDTILSLGREITVNSSDNPEQLSFRSQLQDHYKKQWEDRQSRASLYNDVKSSVDSIGSGFAGLTDNLMNATAGVEDFFRAFIGRSKEGKEAWREFGMSILKTMMKIMTDRITAQFMDFMLNGMGGKSSTVSGAGNTSTVSGAGNTSLLPELLSWGLGAAAGAFSAPIGVGSGMNFNMASPSTPIPMMGAFAEGGPITGGLPNRDSVPIMAMAGEYVLPKHTSSYLGEGFLEGLRSKPEATMRSFSGASAALGKGKSVNQSTNVYVVSPDKVPAGMSRDDVIVTIADDINRNGPIKQLIKQVNHRA